ncbi:TPA: hypothetical protein ACGXM3_005218 [Bacillus cereus]
MNEKQRQRLEKIVTLYKDSYKRFDYVTGQYENMEWLACFEQGKKLIMKLIGEMDKQKMVAVNIFYMLVEKESWIPHPDKEIRGEDFGELFHSALNKLGLEYDVVEYDSGGKNYTLKG